MREDLDLTRMPAHVAIIMDGNGRWAKQRGLLRVQGHRAGLETLREVVRHSQRLGVKYLTVYAFSTENWKRPADEVSGIFKLVVRYVQTELKELCENNVRVRVIGAWDALGVPEESKESLRVLMDTTAGNTGLNFSIALNYGGRAEILKAVNELLASGAEKVDEAEFSKHLYTAELPDPDLVIRTSGENRLSNFLTWQTAYSEIVLTPVYWPDFTNDEYEKCIVEYQSRDRRFGGHK